MTRCPRFTATLIVLLGAQTGLCFTALAQQATDAPPRHDRATRVSAFQNSSASSSGSSSAGSEICNTIVTTDIVLEEDLECGFRVASNVTVDLGGHTVRGGVASCDAPQDCGFGSGENVTLRNGVVAGSIAYDYCRRCVLDRMTIRDYVDFAVELGTENLVIRSRFENNAIGLSSYFGGGRNVVMLSVFEDNGAAAVVGGNNGNVFWANRFVGNGSGLTFWDEDWVLGSENLAVQNVFIDNYVGARLVAETEAERNRFVRNFFWGNRGPGLMLLVHCQEGEPCGAAGSQIERNVSIGNGFEPLEIRISDDEDPEISRTVLVDDGISAPLSALGNANLTLSHNRAFFNADLGIDAAGAVDGGHNRAAGNGDRRQCVGVRCGRGGR